MLHTVSITIWTPKQEIWRLRPERSNNLPKFTWLVRDEGKFESRLKQQSPGTDRDPGRKQEAQTVWEIVSFHKGIITVV